jgi:hypothetical protein
MSADSPGLQVKLYNISLASIGSFMDKHFLSSLFSPGSIAVFAGKPEDPESQTPQARVLHQAITAQHYTGKLVFLDVHASGTWPTWPTPMPIWPSLRCHPTRCRQHWRLPGASNASRHW